MQTGKRSTRAVALWKRAIRSPTANCAPNSGYDMDAGPDPSGAERHEEARPRIGVADSPRRDPVGRYRARRRRQARGRQTARVAIASGRPAGFLPLPRRLAGDSPAARPAAGRGLPLVPTGPRRRQQRDSPACTVDPAVTHSRMTGSSCERQTSGATCAMTSPSNSDHAEHCGAIFPLIAAVAPAPRPPCGPFPHPSYSAPDNAIRAFRESS